MHAAVACVQLKSKIARKLVAREQQARRRNLARHVPDAAAAVFRVLRAMAEDEDDAERAPGPKRRRLVAADDLLAPVRRGEARRPPKFNTTHTSGALCQLMQRTLFLSGGPCARGRAKSPPYGRRRRSPMARPVRRGEARCRCGGQ